MEISFSKDSKIAILGFGVEGQATYQFLEGKGYENLTIFDEKKQADNIENDLSKLSEHDLIFRSPGFHKDHPNLKGLNVTSATQLFFELCPCKTIGITGTKGKGTTSTLIYEILKEAGKAVYLGGNIGIPALTFLDELDEESIAILELSSFQLHDLTKSPNIGIILNTTSEHLDYHKDTEEYLQAKEAIVKFQKYGDAAIVNIDYPYFKRYEDLTEYNKFYVSAKKQVAHGAYTRREKIYLLDDEICNTDEVGLIGPHNLENILPAIMAASILKIPNNIIKKVVQEFKGLPHRIEFIREHKSVKFYNDSFSTTPETCIAAINSFKEPLILIAGGSEKKSDYDELGKKIASCENLKEVILMGKTAKSIKASIEKNKDIKPEITIVANYHDAFDLALEKAWEGYVILLSPACASFDQFKNYKDRGEKFRNWVESL
ncbi:UDP-N-acetylmuramoyl-L-alanine--D-glutamate ligase [Patescibacteria group bacterium]